MGGLLGLMRALNIVAAGALVSALGVGGCVGSGSAPGPTWARGARALVEQSCIACHDGRSHAPSFVSFDDVAGHAVAMHNAATLGMMPPFVVERDGSCGTFLGPQPPTAEDLDMFSAWIDAGMPKGDDERDARPPERASVPGDRVVIPAYVPTGSAAFPGDDHRCFIVALDDDEGAGAPNFLISLSAELSSESDAALHHVLAFTLATDDDTPFAQALDDNDPGPGWSCPGPTGVPRSTIAAVWAPGAPTTRFPDGAGVALAARPLVLQLHVAVATAPTPVSVSLHVGTAASVVRSIVVRTASTTDFLLPAHEDRVEHEARVVPAESNGEIVAVFPHMHRAGTSLRLTRDDGTCLLDVPRWRYTSQELVQPAATLRIGAHEPLTLDCAWTTVDRDDETRFGEGTSDEMCSVFLFVALENAG